MATKFKFEIESDGLTTAQTLAFRTFIGTLGGAEFLEDIRQEEVKEEKPKATRKKAEKPEAPQEEAKPEAPQEEAKPEAPQEEAKPEAPQEEAKPEAPQEEAKPEAPQEEAKPEAIEVVEPETVSAPTLMQIRSLVAQKAAEHKDTIKAKLVELGAQNVSTLDAKHFQTIFDFLTEL